MAPDFEVKPSPRCSEESEDEFVSRCMSSDEAQRTHPERDVRAAMCHSLYERECGENEMAELWEKLGHSLQEENDDD